MNRLFYCKSEDGVVDLAIEGDVPESQNIFTVIVGKNGVGKSRLLSEIAKRCTRGYTILPELLRHRNSDSMPKLIAVSTSPFDKFPSNRKSASSYEIATNYRYVGMRGEGPFGVSSAVSLLSSAAKGWLEKLASMDNTANLLDVFNSLNFEPYAEFVFKPGYIGKPKSVHEQEDFFGNEVLREIGDLSLKYDINLDERYFNQLSGYNEHQRHDIYAAMIEVHRFEASRKAVTLAVDFTSGEFYAGSHNASGGLAKAILVLLSAGLMRLMDVRLTKKDYGAMSLKRASSGEQCLLVMMLGIAGHITDNSIILIDEPEISLHPRWQEEFIVMLTSTFSSYSGCQFLIATHSPQIISRLNADGCYITSLSNHEIYKASYFSNRSADYQLAELFDAPGIMNEYIARLAFSLLSKIKAAKRITSDNLREIQQLQHLAENVDQNDPTKELVASVVQVCEIYADN